MARRLPQLPELPETGRRYLDGTQRARLASPGIERYVSGRGRGRGRWLVALMIGLGALCAALVWMGNR
jgi:hypothetical protein